MSGVTVLHSIADILVTNLLERALHCGVSLSSPQGGSDKITCAQKLLTQRFANVWISQLNL